MKKITLQLAVIALFVMAILSINSTQVQAEVLKQQLDDLVSAKGADYVAIRENIISKKAEFLPILKSRMNESDWHIQLAAKAILSHIEDPETYTRYEERIMTVGGPWRYHSPPSFYDQLRGTVFSPQPGLDARFYFSAAKDSLKEASWPWFYAEVAYKQSVLKRPIRDIQIPNDDPEKLYTKDQVADICQVSQETAKHWLEASMMRIIKAGNGEKQVSNEDLRDFVKWYLKENSSTEYKESVRCSAMMILSYFSDNPVVIPLLTELLQSNESTKIRGYAALALGASGNPGAIEPLTKAASDSDSQVKEAAQRALKRLYEIMKELEGFNKE
jgi:hypothetical protein